MRHVCYTCHLLPEDDVRKFSLSTPHHGSWAFRRLLEHKDGSPTSKQILQDIVKVFENMEMIQLAKGTLIVGTDRNGRRALEQHVSGINMHGEKRVRQPEKDRVHWIHPDAHSAYALKLETRTALHAGWKSENKENHDSDAQFIEDEGEDCL
jgi:hypothetical protein